MKAIGVVVVIVVSALLLLIPVAGYTALLVGAVALVALIAAAKRAMHPAALVALALLGVWMFSLALDAAKPAPAKSLPPLPRRWLRPRRPGWATTSACAIRTWRAGLPTPTGCAIGWRCWIPLPPGSGPSRRGNALWRSEAGAAAGAEAARSADRLEFTGCACLGRAVYRVVVGDVDGSPVAIRRDVRNCRELPHLEWTPVVDYLHTTDWREVGYSDLTNTRQVALRLCA